MTLFNVSIKKKFIQNQQSWGNRYIVRASSMAAAHNAALTILVPMEIDIHSDQVEFLELLTSTRVEGDNLFLVSALGGLGDVVTADVIVPIQTVFEAVTNPSGGGRPGRKFYHTCYDRSALDDTQHWTTANVAVVDGAVNTGYFAMHTGETPVVTPNDVEMTSAIVKPEYRYHQFTKASKRALP